ncbi:DoxX family protein [Pedobacter puniceum]|uniref:DoxX family membrane protein n=1 Tax=Pedobacter puniceum TaxID=2666136 RepID=A0A7K0FQC4_9SPHI|nr:DoxX family protein [Pedobacter puniceum]MRX47470.1 DoxX family membrane protein [Pedobacter puniceum]
MKSKILFVLSLIFGLMFVNAGLNKFFNYMPMPEDMPESMVKLMAAYTTIVWLMPLVAVVEIIGGVLIIIPRFRALAAIMVLPITVGILLTHIFNEPSGLPIALAFFAVNVWLLFEYREKYMPMMR